VEKLGALGYVGGGAPAETSTPGADPKDKIEEFRVVNSLIREALLDHQRGDDTASAAKLRRVLARGVQSSEVHFYLARALLALGQRAAGEHFDEAARRSPGNAEAWEGGAQARLRAGYVEGALSRLREGQKASPADVSLRLSEARILRDRRRWEEARRAYEEALPLAPRSAPLRRQLGELLRDMGRPDEAVARLREAVDLEPSVAGHWNALGMTLGGTGQIAEAEKAFREAWRLDATNHHHAYNLGLALLRQGRGAEARPWFERALALDPRFTPAREQLAQLRGTGGS
jgi:tetratricopeptide (TPR) repeat protein